MRKLVASALCVALVVASIPGRALAAPRGMQTGQISGTAVVEGKPLPNVTVRLRNVDTNEVVSSSTTNAQGGFSFAGLPAGNFVVETVANGVLLGTSGTIALAAGAMIIGAVTVNVSAAAASAAGLGLGAGAAAGAGAGATAGAGAAAGGSFFASAAGLATLGGLAGATVVTTAVVTGS